MFLLNDYSFMKKTKIVVYIYLFIKYCYFITIYNINIYTII